jgi:hypothetical protein
MDIPECGHKLVARVSSHEDLVAAQEQAQIVAAAHVCGSTACVERARQYVRSVTGRGVTYYIPLRDLEDCP